MKKVAQVIKIKKNTGYEIRRKFKTGKRGMGGVDHGLTYRTCEGFLFIL